jgi:hypothetical protein
VSTINQINLPEPEIRFFDAFRRNGSALAAIIEASQLTGINHCIQLRKAGPLLNPAQWASAFLAQS